MGVSRDAALTELRERAGELADLRGMGALLSWDQHTHMPPGGAGARAEQLATLERIWHQRLTDPGLDRVLTSLEPQLAQSDPGSVDARLANRLRRDVEKAVRVPPSLAVEIARAAASGYEAWAAARQVGDFEVQRPELERTLELRHRYAACFADDPRFAHPYDVLLDDFEPGLTTAELIPLFSALGTALVPLVANATAASREIPDVLAGAHPIPAQRALIAELLPPLGYDPAGWRLDDTLHPFAQSLDTTDVRLTTRYEVEDLAMALYSVIHEFGHGLYESGFAPALRRTTLDEAAGLGIHESQSRLWENVVGRSLPFAGWLLDLLRRHLGGFEAVTAQELFRSVNAVAPSLIRISADETTYNLHIILRFEIELALLEQRLEVPDLPAAWDEGVRRLLGLDVPDNGHGVLQDVHWGTGMIGYFPTYTLGNLMAAQLWERIQLDVPGVEEGFARGDFAPLREWLREHVHRYGRTLDPREVLKQATGEDLRAEPLLGFLEGKLRAANLLG
jgi:carboxypeptidase Taq